jgi:hypothetical protein
LPDNSLKIKVFVYSLVLKKEIIQKETNTANGKGTFFVFVQCALYNLLQLPPSRQGVIICQE